MRRRRAAVGLVAGALLTSYLSWRWGLFVNVPTDIVTRLVARYVHQTESNRRPAGSTCLVRSPRQPRGRAGVGRPTRSTDQTGVSTGATQVVISLIAAAFL